jgi:hypothetical protein
MVTGRVTDISDLGGLTPDSPVLRRGRSAPGCADFRCAMGAVMRDNNSVRHDGGAPSPFVALLRFEADAYRLRAWLIHAFDLLDSEMPLAADELRLLKEDVSEAADLARKLIEIYDNQGERYFDRASIE